MTRQFDLPVPRDLVGDNAPSVLPGDDPAILGHATLGPTDPVEVRTFQSFTLTYTVGSLGLDDSGGIRIAWRRMPPTSRVTSTQPTPCGGRCWNGFLINRSAPEPASGSLNSTRSCCNASRRTRPH